MNQNSMIVVGSIGLVVLATGLLFYATQNAEISSATSTPIAVVSIPEKTDIPSSERPLGPPIVRIQQTVAPTDTTVVVTGTVTPNGSLTTYWYEYGTTPALGKSTSKQLVGSGFNPIPTPGYITGLTKDTTYYYRVVAENSFGTATDVQHSFVTTHESQQPVGSAPNARTVSASGMTGTTANLNGEVTPNKVATQHWFEYGTTANLGNTTAFSSVGDGLGKTAVSQSLSGLIPGITYFFRINAQNQFGTVNGAILNFKTSVATKPAAPSANTGEANAVTKSTASIRGTIDPNGLETTYWFEYSTDSLIGPLLLNITDKKTVASDARQKSVNADLIDLSEKTTYFFRIVAENSLGTVRGERELLKTK